MRTRFERQQELCRVNRWLQEFHANAPILFTLMCCGLAIFIGGVAGMLVSLLRRLF